MKIIRDPAQTAPCVLVLGMFDGVHRGHQALLMQGVTLAEAHGLPLNVCTFEPHPLNVLRPEKAPARLTTQAERAQLMAGFGVDSLCVMTFSHKLADQPPEDFMAQMEAVFSPKYVVCGFNFTFGRRGMGTGESLRAYGMAHGFETVIVPEVMLEGETVSSTRIRGLLDRGCIREAARLLGHAYTLTGRVQGVGLPTARIASPRTKALPAAGCYACFLTVEGQHFPAIVRIGADGTVDVRVLDAMLVLRGRTVRLTFMQCLSTDAAADETSIEEQACAYFFAMV